MTEFIQRMESDTYRSKRGTIHYLGANFINEQQELCSPNQAAGVNFAVYAPDADQLTLCLFDEQGKETVLPMQDAERGIWSVLVPGVSEGQQYGFRADGRWAPDEGLRFNRNKVLTDPYSREVTGHIVWRKEFYDYSGYYRHEWVLNKDDNKHLTPKSVVRTDAFDWQGIKKPIVPEQQEVIYEVHVKGFTRKHPKVPKELQGKYLGMCHPVMIDYLKSLGVTTVELMPVTSFASEERLGKLGLKNYWGYNPLCFMAPEESYAIDDPVNELKTMVRELHRAGIKVLMDVVYNHTCEAGSDGPTFNLRGLAERDYYLLDHHNGHMVCSNYSGCGNTLNFDTPQSIKLLMDSLRHWAEHYQIDGFRFDLAPSMARKHRQFDPASPFFQAVFQDPVLSRCQMIAEPWDLGPDGYRLCGFPREWQEWNDRYRDGIRAFWRGDRDRTVDLAWRIAGSRDIFTDKRPRASINYICSHDGFTLNDLVSYELRHNLANGEDNRDGDSHNYSWNSGEEGHTDNPEIIRKREQAKRNMFATLLLSRSTPMFLAGDEFGNSQHGNNNVYCQDNEIGWLDWSWLDDNSKQPDRKQLHTFVTGMIGLRRQHPILGLCYQAKNGEFKTPVQEWFSKEGYILDGSQLSNELGQCLGVRYRCEDHDHPSLVVLINNSSSVARFDFPGPQTDSCRYYRVLSTAKAPYFKCEVVLNDGWFDVPENSVIIIEEQYTT